MNSYEARRIIEALRSGVPSKAVGRFFSNSRPATLKLFEDYIDQTANESVSSSFVFLGKYGEGKTHMLNTVFNMAHERNMVVSMISLSKETPLSNMPSLYQKLISNTFLPDRQQPGFMADFDEKMKDSAFCSDLLLYTSSNFACNKLFYLLKTYQKNEDSDLRYLIQSDLCGNFIKISDLKRGYKEAYGETLKLSETFAKTRHINDYFCFMSYLFSRMGYNGWVILFDEAELIGRFPKKSRMKSYQNMAYFLLPPKQFSSVFSVFAFTETYIGEVIDGKGEYDVLKELYPDQPEPVRTVLNRIVKAHRLSSLTKEEIEEVMSEIINLHQLAYGWKADVSMDLLMCKSERAGFLLRTKLRAAIEYLDQLYQYGDVGNISTDKLLEELFPELPFDD